MIEVKITDNMKKILNSLFYQKPQLNKVLKLWKLHRVSMIFRNGLMTPKNSDEKLYNRDILDIFNIENNKWVGCFGFIDKKDYILVKKINYVNYEHMMRDINRRYMGIPKL